MNVVKTAFLAATLFVSIGSQATPAPSPEVIVSGKVELDSSLTEKAKGIRVLYLSLYDADGGRLPYAAAKIELDKDAQEAFHTFSLTQSQLIVMNPEAKPQNLHIKAKLDKDGVAGPETPGDLTGFARGVKAGASDVVIKIDQAH